MFSCGIYGVHCLANNKIYIGSTNNFKRRLQRHVNDLKNNRHDNLYLQRAWNKYGSKVFRFRTFSLCDESELIKEEQRWIDRFEGCVFNMQPAGKPPVNSGSRHWLFGKGHLQAGPLNPRWGKKHTEEWKKQQSIRSSGRKVTEATKRKMAKNKKNLKLSNEQVLEIKRCFVEGKLSNYRLAKMYNVSCVTIGMIKKGVTHRYIGRSIWPCFKL